MAHSPSRKWLAALGVAAAATLTGPAAVHATSASSQLGLNGGDLLEANAFHCTAYFRHCSWQTSAKLLGNHRTVASWIQNSAEIKAHGISPKISLGKSVNIEISFKSRTLIKTRWRNTHSWIS